MCSYTICCRPVGSGLQGSSCTPQVRVLQEDKQHQRYPDTNLALSAMLPLTISSLTHGERQVTSQEVTQMTSKSYNELWTVSL